MLFNDLIEAGMVCCPNTGVTLEKLEPWLYSSERTGALFPIICDTPVLHPDMEPFLEASFRSVARAMAEIGLTGEARDWFFSRFDSFSSVQEPEMDSGIQGEGYPGFWNQLTLADFVQKLVALPPEQRIMDMIGDHRPGCGLDLGCGQGGMMQRMAGVCSKVVGLDNNFFLTASANRFLRASEIPIRYFIPEQGPKQTSLVKRPVHNALAICGDANFLPFNRNSFDWVHCGHFLDLVDDPAELVEQLLEVMDRDALLTIATPWDTERADHFEIMFKVLEHDFEELHRQDGVPWLRFNHKRRFVLHDDWLWMGRRLRR